MDLQPSPSRLALAKKRIVSVLRAQGVANQRTLEQKISDGGPTPQRIDPHILTTAKNLLIDAEAISAYRDPTGTPWFYLNDTPAQTVQLRLQQLLPLYSKLRDSGFTIRQGQTLEIAAYRALLRNQNNITTFGAYFDIDINDDSTPYKKEEPPSTITGRTIQGKQKLDFIVAADGLFAGLEIKNTREWIYTDRIEVKDLLRKAIAMDVVPVLIARRIHYSAFQTLTQCGVIVHEVYNQLFPKTDEGLAMLAARKDLLGYHDIRVGNEPDKRLLRFIGENLPKLIAKQRPIFDDFKDLLIDFSVENIAYPEFAARVRRRVNGTNEDNDWDEA